MTLNLARRYLHLLGCNLHRISPVLHQEFPPVHSQPFCFYSKFVHLFLSVQQKNNNLLYSLPIVFVYQVKMNLFKVSDLI